jgi:hypothetical protein
MLEDYESNFRWPDFPLPSLPPSLLTRHRPPDTAEGLCTRRNSHAGA